MNMVEKIARAMTADHYSMRFKKPIDDDHVIMNVDANWGMFERQARIAIETLAIAKALGETK